MPPPCGSGAPRPSRIASLGTPPGWSEVRRRKGESPTCRDLSIVQPIRFTHQRWALPLPARGRAIAFRVCRTGRARTSPTRGYGIHTCLAGEAGAVVRIPSPRSFAGRGKGEGPGEGLHQRRFALTSPLIPPSHRQERGEGVLLAPYHRRRVNLIALDGRGDAHSRRSVRDPPSFGEGEPADPARLQMR
jgi:hypothetical protein